MASTGGTLAGALVHARDLDPLPGLAGAQFELWGRRTLESAS